MEKKFYNEEFEQFLRDSVENFQMFPSRKVWYGIYNDLHPSKKWPSLAITLILVSAVLFLGISNNNSINRNTTKNGAKTLLAQTNPNNINSTNITAHTPSNPQPNFNTATKNSHSGTKGTIHHPIKSTASPISNGALENISKETHIKTVQTKATLPKPNSEQLVEAPLIKNAIIETSAATNVQVQNAEMFEEHLNNAAPTSEKQIEDNQNSTAVSLPLQKQEEKKETHHQLNDLQKEEERKWVENYAFYNKPAQKRWKSRSLVSFYITPSVGFRTFKSTNHSTPANTSIAVNNNAVNRDINEFISQASAVNLEVGSMLLYNLSKNIRLKAGLQFNYSNYISFAEHLSHTTQTTLLLKTPNGQLDEVPVTTMYKNNYSNPYALSRINNKSLQLSIPIGADFKVAGKQKLKLYTGATIQPTLITGGNAYAISADKRYYAEYPSLMRKFNVNTSLETYLSYTTANGASIIVGPQVRYQLFSSFNKRYLYSEKRYNVGVKIGFTTNF